MAEQAKPWERQFNESHQAFEAFHEYCLLGAKRTQAKVAAKLGKSTHLMDRWSSKWKWRERARAYDNELVRQEIDEKRAEIAEMRKRQIDTGRFLQSKALDALVKKAKEADGDGLKFEEIRDLLNLITKGSEMEEHARTEGLRALSIGAETVQQSGDITDERRKEIEEFFDAE